MAVIWDVQKRYGTIKSENPGPSVSYAASVIYSKVSIKEREVIHSVKKEDI